MCHRNGIPLALALLAFLLVTAAGAEEPAPAPAEGGFFSKLAGAAKKGATDGVDNGVQMSGHVKVLGYTMQHSDIARSDQPAFCLANADTEKLITVVPVFGRPYQRTDGTTGFTQLAKSIDPHHDKIEVNALNVLPGLNCADLISKHKLNVATVAGSTNNDGTSGAGGGSNAAQVDPSKQCTQHHVPVDNGTGDQYCMRKDGTVVGIIHYTRKTDGSGYDMAYEPFKQSVSIGVLKAGGGVDSSGNTTLPANVQAGWDNVDRIQKEGMAKIQADSAARESANADKSMMRRAAMDKCKPLIKGGDAQMTAFKACFKEATQ